VAPSGFEINKRAIARMTREIQREFDKHPISLPVQASGPDLRAGEPTVYNGPVINVHGDRAQIAWGNSHVAQTNTEQNQISPGFEALAQALAITLEGLTEAGLSDDDRSTAEDAAKEVLGEVIKDEPDGNVSRRGVSVVRGILAPLALGVQHGVSDTVSDWAKTAVEQLTSTLS
jgi:hypothetical protein